MKNKKLFISIVPLIFFAGTLVAMEAPINFSPPIDQKNDGLSQPSQTAIMESDALVERGNRDFSKGDIKTAITIYNQAIEQNFLNGTAFYNRATAFVRLSEFELAIADFTEVIQLSPDFAPAFYGRAVAYRLGGNPSAAIKDHDTAILLTPAKPDGFYNRALSLALLERWDEAVRDLSRAIELNASFASAYKARGQAYFSLGSFMMALRDYDRAWQLDKSDMTSIYNSGLVLARMRNFKQAEEAFSFVLNRNPDHVPTLILRAEMRVQQGHKAEALQDINQAIKLDPSSKKALQIRNSLSTTF